MRYEACRFYYRKVLLFATACARLNLIEGIWEAMYMTNDIGYSSYCKWNENQNGLLRQ